jgi:hypothetical protein
MFRTVSVHLQDSFLITPVMVLIEIDEIDKMSSTMLSMCSLKIVLKHFFLFFKLHFKCFNIIFSEHKLNIVDDILYILMSTITGVMRKES